MADRCYRYDMTVIPLSADSYIEVQDGKTIEESNIISLSGKKELNKMEKINLEVSAENCIFARRVIFSVKYIFLFARLDFGLKSGIIKRYGRMNV